MFARLQSGTQIKQYTLQEQLGRGASGDVWKASDGGQLVAIKFMNEQLVDSDQAEKHLKRLRRERRSRIIVELDFFQTLDFLQRLILPGGLGVFFNTHRIQFFLERSNFFFHLRKLLQHTLYGLRHGIGIGILPAVRHL